MEMEDEVINDADMELLSAYTIEEIEAILAKRKKGACPQMRNRGDIIDGLTEVLKEMEKQVKKEYNDNHVNSDDYYNIWEDMMILAYGPDIMDWYNNQ
jgi:hypothetical protein